MSFNLNPNASSFVPGRFSFQPQAQPQPQPTQQPQQQPKAQTQTQAQPQAQNQGQGQPQKGQGQQKAQGQPQKTQAQPQTQKTQTKPQAQQPQKTQTQPQAAAPVKDSWEDEDNEVKEKSGATTSHVDNKPSGEAQTPKEVPSEPKTHTLPTKQEIKTSIEDDEGGDEEEELAIVDDDREHLNIVFIGHVDAGKSTISGNILFLTGMVDMRTIEKYEREAKEKSRASWFLAFIMDTNEEERAKGKTVEVGRAHFATQKKRFTILDAPGHKNYVPNMISGVAQADIGVLVISARKGEFEAGFDRSGQTREHAVLAKTLGVKKLIVVVNKMDESTVNWSKERYDHIETNLGKFLRSIGYLKNDVEFVPISGLQGYNIQKRVDADMCPWYQGKSLLDTLDELNPLERMDASPLRFPVLDKYKESGKVYILGKIESGVLTTGDVVKVMPGGVPLTVGQLQNDMGIITVARPGENTKIVVKGGQQVEEDSLYKGVVICHPSSLSTVTSDFVAQIQVLELLEHKSLFTAGYECVIHIHTAVEEVTVTMLLDHLDKKGKSQKKLPKFVQDNQLVIAHLTAAKAICMEKFEEFPQLGRFTLRDEGKTIAFGKILATHAPTKTKRKV